MADFQEKIASTRDERLDLLEELSGKKDASPSSAWEHPNSQCSEH